ncbi:MAG: hypothetical protein PHR35_21190 [Kiritimatiellae bacterium]|nr:hypothetical protein [Kiritimatiellia bacterium]
MNLTNLCSLSATLLLLAAPSLRASSNLVFNGDFSFKDDPLAGWTVLYDLPGESWYTGNEKHVTVVDDGARKQVLRLNVATVSIADNQGVKTDSRAFAVDPRRNYRFSVYARGTGPMARIMLEGYYRHPKAKPATPDALPEKRTDMRLAFRYPMIYFKKGDAGGMAQVPGQWKRESITIKGTDDKSAGYSKIAIQNMNKVRFMVVHIVAIGKVGDLYIDDVQLEEVR